jgi:hypothetical protein
VSCAEIRERLAEYALGVLPPSEAREVARHLQWCAGCQKESDELREGATAIALSLPDAGTPARLEGRVVDTLAHAAGRRQRAPWRLGIRALAVAALTAALVAVGATGWAVIERNKAQSALSELIKISNLGKLFPGSYRADLAPPSGTEGLAAQAEGTTLISSSPQFDDLVVTSAFFPQAGGGPYTFKLLDRTGTLLSGGTLLVTRNGGLLAYEFSGQDLSKAIRVDVFNGSGHLVLTGLVKSVRAG